MLLRASLVVALVGLTLASVAVGAGRIPSEVSLGFDDDPAAFEGEISSTSATCAAHRRVVIKKLRDGNDVPVAEGRTDDDGAYRLPFAPRFKTYYAQVRGENRGAREVPCKGDRSPTITFAQAEPVSG
jgi:hypothetical protein